MNQNEFEATEIIAPLLNTSSRLRIANIAVTTSSARHNLATRITSATRGRYLRFTAHGGDIAIAFNNADSGSVDNTTTTSGVSECDIIPDGQSREWKLVDDYTWCIVQGSGACVLRVAVASRAQGQTAADL